MIYVDTDFFLALLKKQDWLKTSAKSLLRKYQHQLWTSTATLIELLLVASNYKLDPERILIDALELVEVRETEAKKYLVAAHYIKDKDVGVFDAIHAAFCGRKGKIISSDKVFDKLGLERIQLGKGKGV